MQRIIAVACVATLGVAASACGEDVATPTSSVRPRASTVVPGTILFSDRTGFFMIRPDGSGRRRIEIDDEYHSGPWFCAWSPDRQQLACADADGFGISLVGVDGSGPRDIEFDSSGFVESPSWSPDGRRVAFLDRSEDLGGPFLGDLYAVDVRSGEVERLTNTPVQEDMARWSPDGTRVAFGELAERADGRNGVFVLELATGRTRRLADGFLADGVPAVWSPDGTALGYSTQERAGEPAGVWVVDVATGRTRRLADDTGAERGRRTGPRSPIRRRDPPSR